MPSPGAGYTRLHSPASALAALAALAALSGCVPVAALAPPAANPMFTTASPDDPHHLGERIPARDSLVIMVVGDNRPGYRTQSQRFGYPQLRSFSLARPRSWLPAVVAFPLALVQVIVPTFDGPQDLVTRMVTHRPNGGGEAQVRDAMMRMLPADLTLNMGDLVSEGHRAQLWRDFERKFGTPDGTRHGLRAVAPYLAAPGNHERLHTPEGSANWSAVMGAPARPGRFWFSVDAGDDLARFIFLDSNVLANVHGVYSSETADTLAREQLAWLDHALDTTARFRFVVLHHPLVTVGHHGGDWLPEASARRRDEVLTICARRGVTAVLAGHEHLYARIYAKQDRAATGEAVDHRGFWLITTGGGGGPLHQVDAETHAREMARILPAGLRFAPESRRIESVHHFLRLVLPSAPGEWPHVDVFSVDHGGHTKSLERISLAPIP